MALNEQTDAVFKSSRTDLDAVPDNTVGVDPESGNEVPLGSLPEEVRDDIPAQLSEGEYVVPADVVRYYGVKFFEDLRAEAKFGYQDMNENGRIGGEPAGMEMVDPEDDMMFDMSELEVMEVPEEPVREGFADGGYALNPGDPGYDEKGALGLGSEGIGLGSDVNEGSVIEMVAYVNEEGRVIYILHIDGVPQTEIPPGFDRRTEEEDTTEEDATDAQPIAQVVTQSDDGGGPDIPDPTPIDYQKLTIDEMQELMNDMNSKTTKAVGLGVAALSGPVGLLLKGAMMHQERRLRKEMERRLGDELTTQDRARLEGMIREAEDKKGGIFGSLTGKVADLVIGKEQGPGMDIQPPTTITPEPTTITPEPTTYTPEVTAGSVTLPTTPKPEGLLDLSVDDLVEAFSPPEMFAMEEYRNKQARKAEREAAAAAAAARKKVLEGKVVSTPSKPITPLVKGSDDNDPVMAARRSARQGTQDVLGTMRERGAGRTERTAAVREGARVENVMADQARGIQRGFKKGGLASKKKKK